MGALSASIIAWMLCEGTSSPKASTAHDACAGLGQQQLPLMQHCQTSITHPFLTHDSWGQCAQGI
jgi:hypothetical protein